MKMKNAPYAQMGNMCRRFREEKLGITQGDIAVLAGYGKENISGFECGRNNNARILLTYIGLGLLTFCDVSELIEG
jgi:transcriptional regulator with XRE-family HTH domain